MERAVKVGARLVCFTRLLLLLLFCKKCLQLKAVREGGGRGYDLQNMGREIKGVRRGRRHWEERERYRLSSLHFVYL